MNNELKEFYTLSELEVLVAENLDIDITVSESLITGNPVLILKTKDTEKEYE